MIAPSNINPPKNWQDFEMLCLRLWGEIWNIPDEIEFNSDNAQGQDGVDIYGAVDAGRQYNGIQCKNKKLNVIDGSPNRITISDIKAEIDKARSFKPSLSKLVIATSLPKDKKVEEFVRLQSVENVNNGQFAVQICFWEYFERKLPEYPRVYDWYLKNENRQLLRSASVFFSGGETEILYRPKFQWNLDQYILRPEERPYDFNKVGEYYENWLKAAHVEHLVFLENQRQLASLGKNYPTLSKFYWYQIFQFRLCIRNSGQSAIEYFKLELDFIGDHEGVEGKSRSGTAAFEIPTDIHEYSNTINSLYVKPSEKILVPGDSYTTGYIYLKPPWAKKGNVTIYWKLLSKDFQDSGKLAIKINPLYHQVTNTFYVETIEEVREEYRFSLIERPGGQNCIDNSIKYSDNESDYNFVEL